MVKSQLVYVCPGEAELIDAMKRVQFGEMFGVEVDTGGGDFIGMDLSPAAHDLLLYIRSGVQYIDVLTVHQGQPTQAETDSIINGFRCRKRIRFPVSGE